DDLVAATGDAEAIDEVAAHRRREVLTDLLKIEAQLGNLVAVDFDFRLRLINFHVNLRREGEDPALSCFLLELLREPQDLLALGGGGENELYRKLPAARQRRQHHGERLDAGNDIHLGLHFGQDFEGRPLALLPGLEAHAPKSTPRLGYLKGEPRLRDGE